MLTDFDFCVECPYIPYCTGNCPGLAYALTGQVDHPSPDACLRCFLEDGGTILAVGPGLPTAAQMETGRRRIWVMNADGSERRNVSKNLYNDWDPVWIR